MVTKDTKKVDTNGSAKSPLDGMSSVKETSEGAASQMKETATEIAQETKAEVGTEAAPQNGTVNPKDTAAMAQNTTVQPNGVNPNWLMPENTWPTPIFFNSGTASAQERYYIEHRWYSQWSYYDGKASEAKRAHQRLQLVIAIGSVIVPVLVGLNIDGAIGDLLRYLTVIISIIVAAAAAIETVKQYGDNWRNFRSAAEELKREKSMYDVQAGPYRKSKDPFLLFVERSEDIMAKQNGAWIALKEEAAEKTKAEEDSDIDNPAAGTSYPASTPVGATTPAQSTTGSDLG